MVREFTFVILLVLLATSEALPPDTLSNHNQMSAPSLSQKVSSSHGFLRIASTAGGEDEERNKLGPKLLMKLSKLAEKQNMYKLSKRMEHKSWLSAGETPQTLFKKNGWKGKTIAELKADPKYLRYEGFDDVWTKAQYEKGTLYTPKQWISKMKEEEKRGQR
ncbi:secreted RxLR effector peptide protein, putative [Phytophthora infestans T30-4]|uniref:RxLR effector protein n=1 Tax=Phytophthora infestans (strain T30-4) TaxID=403677 RepID=D0MR61_PHYIT|nr:secreted RxLR effector peptide protein, putative [Phytophthora infestans T30-4]EEY57980.1 secreted RxLR effector peptide protein, putative [Phytophthora infestans T30-4]|eukprot:XP_002909166.1 secreted RxLR effector peptide protein, putative [Phytophthora infestans T30-4]